MSKAEKLYDSLVAQVAKELMRLKPEMLEIVNTPSFETMPVNERAALVISQRLKILSEDALGQVTDRIDSRKMTDSLLNELGISTTE
jgi:hypothetical protein